MRYVAVVAIFGASLALCSCSSGPRPPQPGTPAFFWAAAKSTYNSGDYAKAHDHLGRIIRNENEFTAKAEPWLLVLSAGMTHALMDLSESYEQGIKANKVSPAGLRRQSSACRSLAGSTALQGLEVFHKFCQKNKDPQIALAFEYPPLSPAEPPQLQKITSGMLLAQPEADLLQQAMVQRGVIYAVARVVGAPDDPAKARETFKAANPQVPREQFLFGRAQLVFEQAGLYDQKRLNDPDRANLFCTEAAEALGGIPQNKQVKELLQSIQRTQKKLRLT